ncbi:MAG: hypothetical protein RBT05_11995 [Bacteroidales bacterium]|jgi:hypothetical protein|nr:hypothetical protein [Bacteroidales bacterium]
MNAKLRELIDLLSSESRGVKEIEVNLIGEGDIRIKVKYFTEAEKQIPQPKGKRIPADLVNLYNNLPEEFTWAEAKRISRKAHNTQLSRLLRNGNYFTKIKQGNYKKVYKSDYIINI